MFLYMIQTVSIIILLVSVSLALLLSYVDKAKERNHHPTDISFIIPCYNDGHVLPTAVKSISGLECRQKQILVIDDASTDNTADIIQELEKDYDIQTYKNDINLGKAETLNKAAKHADHDVIFFVDADVTANQEALDDALARLQKEGVGGVSCPYDPKGKSFFSVMQRLEYNMLSLIQGAYNVFSAIAMWGGFLGVKKQAFKESEGFKQHRLTEDMDMAFTLNREGWRVEQSFVRIKSAVPQDIASWFKQKLRWNAGGLQCFLNYVSTWITNPLHVFMILSTFVVMTGGAYSLLTNITFFDTIIERFIEINNSAPLLTSIQSTIFLYGFQLITDVAWTLGFTIFSIPYVLPQIHSIKEAHLFLLAIPFSALYIPVFTWVSIIAAGYYLYRSPSLKPGTRAW